MNIRTWRSLPFVAGLALAILAGCGPTTDSDGPLDTLAADAWPTESLSSEAGSTKKQILDSLKDLLE